MTTNRAAVSSSRDHPDISAIVLRALIVISPLAAMGFTWLAAGRVLTGAILLVVMMSGACALRPDSHFGILVVATVTIQWLAVVHDHTTPWSIGAAASLTVFHTANAAATVAPATAAWTQSMRRRWVRRTATLVVACAVMWTVVALADASRAGANSLLLTVSLLVLAAGALWARQGSIEAHPPDQR